MENQEEIKRSRGHWAEKWKDKVRIWRGRPTPRQLSTWEIDGGNHNAYDEYILINGRLRSGVLAKTWAYFSTCFKRIEQDLFAKLALFKGREKPLRRVSAHR